MGNIYPIPKEYAEYSKEQILAKADGYFSDIDNAYNELEHVRAKFVADVNHLLQERSIGDKLEQITGFGDYIRLKGYYDDINKFDVLYNIALKEKFMGLPVVLQNVGSVEELCMLLDEIIFKLRRIEFFDDSDSLNILMDNIVTGRISWLCISELIVGKRICDSDGVIAKICNHLNNYGYSKEAYYISSYINEIRKAAI